MRPKLLLVRAGAVPALLDVLRGGAGAVAGEGAQPRGGAGKGKGEAPPPSGAVQQQAAEALECLAGGEEGVKAIRWAQDDRSTGYRTVWGLSAGVHAEASHSPRALWAYIETL